MSKAQTSTPTHLIARSSDTRTICGIRITERRAWPYLLASFLEAHQKGRGLFDVCPTCGSRTTARSG